MINYSYVYIYSDQPATCPLCGARSEIISDLSHTKKMTQIHKCPDSNCAYEFIMQYDEEFEEYDLKVIENDDEDSEVEIFT